jgi:hypothetical protein
MQNNTTVVFPFPIEFGHMLRGFAGPRDGAAPAVNPAPRE